MRNNWKQVVFESLFWTAIGVGAVLTIAAIALGWVLYADYFRGPDHPEAAAIGSATVVLALFTCFLWLAAAITARFARTEISTTTDVNSANLALQLDNRAHSDETLRIRHGAVCFLVETREDLKELKAEFTCDPQDISPYSIDQKPLHGLNSDLIDLFNYYDWIGYLTSERPKTIHLDVVYRKFGPWIINYYQLCKEDLEGKEGIIETDPARWPYLKKLYDNLIKKEEDCYKEGEYRKEPFPGARTPEQIKQWLLREHVRSHRGSTPNPRSAVQDPSTSF